MCFLGGGVFRDEEEEEVELCVASKVRDVESAARAGASLSRRWRIRGRRMHGFRNWIASFGLYMAAIFAFTVV